MKIWKKIGGNIVVTDDEMNDNFWIAKLSEKEVEKVLSGEMEIHKAMAKFESKVFAKPRTERELMRLFPMCSVPDLEREWVWKDTFLTLVVEGEDWYRIGYGEDGKIVLFDDKMEETPYRGNAFSEVAGEVERNTFRNPRSVTVNPKWLEYVDCFRFENVRVRRSIYKGVWFSEIDGRVINSCKSFAWAIKQAEEFVFKYFRGVEEVKSEFPQLSLIWRGDVLYCGGKMIAKLFDDGDSVCVQDERGFVMRAKSRKEAVTIAECLHIP